MDSFRNTDIGYAAAGIHEAMERLFDLLKDVPQQSPPGITQVQLEKRRVVVV